MATQALLRKVRSTIHATTNPRNKHAKQSPNNKANSVDLSTAVESPLSLSTRNSLLNPEKTQRPDSTATEFRRRLARKASTVSLRTKSRRGERVRERKSVLQKKEPSRATITGEDLEKSSAGFRTPTPTPQPVYELSGEQTTPTQKDFPRQTQRTETGKEDGVGSWVKMSADAISPPVPFLRLKEIATDACSAALASQSSYVHSLTESWNTQIINSILGALVQETTPPTASQPQWKYVVNSTIIQHAATSASTSDDAAAKKDAPPAGRRGMHSASGAYWNNERDGMWSFKYEAAEAKGLDVVVGIIWVFVG